MLMAFNLVFIGLLSSPFFAALIMDDIEQSAENRRLTQWQHVSENITEWKLLFNRIDQYWNDQHGFREYLNDLYSFARYKVGVVSSQNDGWVYGKDGWIFEHARENALPEDVLIKWKHYFEYRDQVTRHRNTPYTAFFAPQKLSIYPEKLGTQAQAVWETQLSEYLTQHGNGQVLDIRKTLLSNKQHGQLYHKLDLHWNAFGAHYAHAAVMNHIATILDDDAYKARYYDKSWFRLEDARETGLARALNLQNLLQEKQPWFSDAERFCTRLTVTPIPQNTSPVSFASDLINLFAFKTECPSGKGRALVIMDSFSKLLWVFVSEYFQEVIYISSNPDIQTQAGLEALLEQYEPDIVIEEIAARYIPKPPAKQ